jgi:hypothetical protein
MFPHGTTYPIDVESGIQLSMSDRQFPGSICTIMILFQAAVDDPLNYLLKNILPKLAKKHLGIRKNLNQLTNMKRTSKESLSHIYYKLFRRIYTYFVTFC